jgi:purine-binding chemotaxis protein CheW
VLEEQARDAQKSVVAAAPVVAPVVAAVAKAPVVIEDAPAPILAPVSTLAPLLQTLVPPLVEVHLPPSNTPPPVETDGRPAWAAEPFECLLFDVAGLTLAVPLVCLGSIYSLAGHELTPLFGQPEWFLGILPSQAGNLKVLDTARWVMPDRYRDDFRQGLQYVISVQGYEWGLAVHQVSRSLRLDPNEIKWRSHRGQRPWLAGTVIEHMCALLDVSALAELIASGGAKHMGGSKPLHKPT